MLQGHDIPQFGPHGPHCYELWSAKTAYKRGHTPTTDPTTPPHSTAYTSNRRKEAPNFGHTPRKVKLPTYCERWEDMIADVDLLFQWAIANRLNKIEWLLLGMEYAQTFLYCIC